MSTVLQVIAVVVLFPFAVLVGAMIGNLYGRAIIWILERAGLMSWVERLMFGGGK